MMKQLLCGAAILMLPLTAGAADLPAAQPAYKAPPQAFPVYSWNGFYAGINGGYGWGTSSQHSNVVRGDPSDGSYNINGGFVGGTVGYNWQVTNWILGVEGDYAWSGIKGSTTCDDAALCGTELRSFGTVRGRFGVVQNDFFVYGTGGWAVANVNAYDRFDPQSGSKTRSGWTAGAGVEWKVRGPWSAKLEYLYTDYGTTSHFTNVGHTPEDISLKTNIIRVGVNYSFGGPK
jgi:outer membrane immunogenic protein